MNLDCHNSTIERAIKKEKINCYVAVKYEDMVAIHYLQRLNFCNRAIEWPLFRLYKTCFIDEVRVDNVFNYRRLVWRFKGQRFNRGLTWRIRRSGRVSVHFLCAIVSTGESFILPLIGTLNRHYFLEILQNRLIPWLNETFGWDNYEVDNHPWRIICDNATLHRANIVTQWMQQNYPNRLLFLPPKSPDFNPIEKCFALEKPGMIRLGP